MTAHDPKLSRRSLLAGAGALVIGFHLPRNAKAQSGAGAAYRPGGNATFAPNAFIRVAPDSTVTVLIKHIEFGQGPFTGLATLAAEEMDAAWGQMRAEHAPVSYTHLDVYKRQGRSRLRPDTSLTVNMSA